MNYNLQMCYRVKAVKMKTTAKEEWTKKMDFGGGAGIWDRRGLGNWEESFVKRRTLWIRQQEYEERNKAAPVTDLVALLKCEVLADTILVASTLVLNSQFAGGRVGYVQTQYPSSQVQSHLWFPKLEKKTSNLK